MIPCPAWLIPSRVRRAIDAQPRSLIYDDRGELRSVNSKDAKRRRRIIDKRNRARGRRKRR